MGREKAQNKELETEMERLKRDNERQQKLLAHNLSKAVSGQAPGDALLQSEIMRLTSENLVS